MYLLFVTYYPRITVGAGTIRYDSVYLTCSKKLTGSQLSLPHGINKKLKCETKNKNERDRSSLVLLSRGSPVAKRNLR